MTFSGEKIPERLAFLTFDDAVRIHDDLLLDGQLKSLKREDSLHSAVARAQAAALYDPEADVAKIAAYYWHGITASHAFNDGNKRTGFVSMLVFLEMNGWEFNGPDGVMGPIIYRLFEVDRFTLEVLDYVVRKNMQPVPMSEIY